MKRIMYFILLSMLALGCGDSPEEQMEKQRQARQKASQSMGMISELPYGFRFGMTEEEVVATAAAIEKGVIEKIGYNVQGLKLKLGKKTYLVEPIYIYSENDRLCRLCLSFPKKGNIEDLFDEIKELVPLSLKDGFKEYPYKLRVTDDFCSQDIIWVKENQIVSLSYLDEIYLMYEDAPTKEKKTPTYSSASSSYNDTNYKRRVEIVNSAWDSSVLEVEQYLEKHLKDPDSYEGIDWSDVKEHRDGYSVRHKYRAKNSIGGYVIENQIFRFDNYGTVISVINYNH